MIMFFLYNGLKKTIQLLNDFGGKLWPLIGAPKKCLSVYHVLFFRQAQGLLDDSELSRASFAKLISIPVHS